MALARAHTEAAQCRLTMISGARDDIFREEYSEGPRRSGYAARHAAANLTPGQLGFSQVPDLATDTCAGGLRALEARLAARGLRPIWYAEVTRPEYGLAVVRAIVPGLEGPDEDLRVALGDDGARLAERAVLRFLVEDRAETAHLDLDMARLETEVVRFRARHGLHEPEALQAWLADNDLTPEASWS